jgi:hypothetical protein
MFVFAIAALLATPSAVGDEIWRKDAKSPICAVAHGIGSSGSIEFSRTPGNDETQLKLTLPKRRDLQEGQFHDASLELSPTDKVMSDGGISKRGKNSTIYAVTSDPTFFTKLAGASSLTITVAGAAPVSVAIPAAASAVEALQDCEDGKMRAYGLDPVAWRSLKSRPSPIEPVRNRFSALDYPEAALRAHVEFDAIIRLDVGTDGTVQRCSGLNPGNYKGFEIASCDVLKGAKFKPAVDSAGTVVSAPIIYDVVFRIDS